MAGDDADEIRGAASAITQSCGDGHMKLYQTDDESNLYLKLGRRELQRLCKTHGIKANLPNQVMANELAKLRKGQATPRRFLRKDEKGYRGLDGESATPTQALTYETIDPGTKVSVKVNAESTAECRKSQVLMADSSETEQGKRGKLDEPKQDDELLDATTSLLPKDVTCDLLSTPAESGFPVDLSHKGSVEGPAEVVNEDKKPLDRQQVEDKSPEDEGHQVQHDASKGLNSGHAQLAENSKNSEGVQSFGQTTCDAGDVALENQELAGATSDAQSKAAATEIECCLPQQKEKQNAASATLQVLPRGDERKGDACKAKTLAEDSFAPTASGENVTAAHLLETHGNPVDVYGTLGTPSRTSGRTGFHEPLSNPDSGDDACKEEVMGCTEEKRAGQSVEDPALNLENVMPKTQPMLTSLSVVRILEAEEKRKAVNERLGKFLQQRKPLKVSVFRNMEMTLSRAGIRAKEQKIARDTIIMAKRRGEPQ